MQLPSVNTVVVTEQPGPEGLPQEQGVQARVSVGDIQPRALENGAGQGWDPARQMQVPGSKGSGGGGGQVPRP